MAPSIDISPPTLEDARRLTELFMSDMRDLGLTPTRSKMSDVTAAMLDDPRVHMWVARFSGRVIGVIAAMEMLSIKFPGRALWIEELYVDPAERRSGVGRQLVEHLLDFAESNDFAGVELEAYRMNTAASILYRTVGFRRLARERYSFDLSEDAS